MWNEPHFQYTAYTDPAGFLGNLESSMPGCLVYGLARGRRRFRIKTARDYQTAERYFVYAPVNCAWIVEYWLQSTAARYHVEDRSQGITPWHNTDGFRSALESDGREMIRHMVADGVVKEHVADMPTPYQARGVAWTASRPFALNSWACGSGKTFGAILSAVQARGPVLVVAPAKARHVWWSQVQEYTNLRPYRVKPASDMRMSDEPYEEYLSWCSARRQYPFVIVGLEALPDYVDHAKMLQPQVLILDEIHMHGNPKRWKAINEADGTVKFEHRKTKNGNLARIVSTMEVSRLESLRKRIGLTATALDDGRPRRLWSQLDLLNAGGFCFSYRKFAHRYCAAQTNEYGGYDDKGHSNMSELRQRAAFMLHEVPYSESHKDLPSTRVQVIYLDTCEQSSAERWSDEQTFSQAIQGMTKAAKVSEEAKNSLVEARLAQACTKKRKYVIDEVLQGLQGGGKVVVFTARRREAEKWAAAIQQAISTGDEQVDAPVWMVHGGLGESEKDHIVDSYAKSEGPCCLVATGQSIGTGVDGMQTTTLAIFAMLPWKPGDFLQWKGRFDRLGGVATLLKVVVAKNTYDEKVVETLVDKFGPIEQFLKADELEGLGENLLGLSNVDEVIDDFLDALLGG